MAGAAIFGPISMLFVQKTLKLGMRGAMAVGLGAAFADPNRPRHYLIFHQCLRQYWWRRDRHFRIPTDRFGHIFGISPVVVILGAFVLILGARLSQTWLNRTRYFSATILGGFGLWTLYSAIFL